MGVPDVMLLNPRSDASSKAVVIVLHGGRVNSSESVRAFNLSYRRMVPIARALHRAGSAHDLAVWLVRFRFRGWNAPDLPAVADARWAIAEARIRHPRAPIVLVGHSMGARTALRAGGERGVVGICALAPWLESDEPIEQLSERDVVIVHGTADRWTSPARSLRFAERLRALPTRVARFELPGAGHFMLRGIRAWTSITRRFVLGLLEGAAEDLDIAQAMNERRLGGLQVELSGRR